MEFAEKWNRQTVIDYVKIVAGAFILGISLNVFFEPCHLVAGGVTGLGIIIKELGSRAGIDLPLWLTNILLNAPLFIGAFFLNGRRFILRTAAATVALSASLYLTVSWAYDSGELLINALYGGVVGGIGIGLVLSASATTGGTDLLASILHHFFRHLSVPRLLFVADLVVIVLSVVVFGMNLALYAIIGIFLTSFVADQYLDGVHFSKAFYIISDHSQEIAEALMKELDRGVTGIPVEGKYTGTRREMLYVVMSVRESARAKQIVKTIDPKAFMMVADTKEVLGEGFSEE